MKSVRKKSTVFSILFISSKSFKWSVAYLKFYVKNIKIESKSDDYEIKSEIMENDAIYQIVLGSFHSILLSLMPLIAGSVERFMRI